MTRVAVVGAGIAGLVAAYRLRQRLGPDADILIVEKADRVGGKLRTVDIGGPVDVGAEAFVARRPEIPALLAELGLTDQLVAPSGARPAIRAGGSLHPLPAGTLMGIPSSSASVRGLVDDATCRRIDDESTRPLHWSSGADISVGDLVTDRFGEQVTRRSVDPLLGGVYSGLSGSIGVRAALPTLAAALDAGATSLTEAIARALPPALPGPVFGGIRGGYGIMLTALSDASGARVVTDTPVRSVRRSGSSWSLDAIGDVDGVVLAVPAPVAAELVADAAPELAAALLRIVLASSALVVLQYDELELPDNSGILVATGELDDHGNPLHAKAFTLSSRKWPHLAERPGALIRASFGRFSDAGIVDRPDEAIAAAAVADLHTITGIDTVPARTVVQRWYGGLPQYAPGHLDTVAAIDAAAAELDGFEVAGAYLRGVGVPACAASGTAAATKLTSSMAR